MSFLVFQSWTLILSNGWERKCKAWAKSRFGNLLWESFLVFMHQMTDKKHSSSCYKPWKSFRYCFYWDFAPGCTVVLPVFTHWVILFKTRQVCGIRSTSPHPPSPLLPHPVPLRITWNGKLILTSRRVNKRKKQKYMYLNKLPNISVWKQTFFRGWKENENKTKSFYK